MTIPPPPGYVTFVEPVSGVERTLLLDESTAVSVQETGWTIVPRPGRDAITEWQGRQPVRETIPIIFDKFDEDDSIEDRVRTMEKWAGPTKDKSGKVISFPMPIQIFGTVPHAVGHPDEITQWVIESVDYGPALWHPGGYRTRQYAAVNLMEYLPGPSFGKADPRKTQFVIIPIVKNATAGSIAKNRLKNKARWTEIKDLNPKYKIRSASMSLNKYKGKKIRVPAA
jgi:hypothetical protein